MLLIVVPWVSLTCAVVWVVLRSGSPLSRVVRCTVAARGLMR